MDLYHIVIRPLITEKSTHQAAHNSARRGGAYSFEVHPDANKTQIKDAVQKLYGVNVLSVRTSNKQGKRRRVRWPRPSCRFRWAMWKRECDRLSTTCRRRSIGA